MTDSAQAGGETTAMLGADALFAQVYDRLKAMAGRPLASRVRF